MEKKLSEILLMVVHIIERVIAVVLIGLIAIATLMLVVETFSPGNGILSGQDAVAVFMESCFSLIIGVEFVKVLIKHTPESVIEVLMFTIAKELIVNKQTPLEMLLLVLALGVLFFVRKYFLHVVSEKSSKEKTDADN